VDDYSRAFSLSLSVPANDSAGNHAGTVIFTVTTVIVPGAHTAEAVSSPTVATEAGSCWPWIRATRTVVCFSAKRSPRCRDVDRRSTQYRASSLRLKRSV
jgi:hypothetical protein